MRQIITILLCLTLIAPSTQAARRKNALSPITQPTVQEPDALMEPLKPQRALEQLSELNLRRRRTLGKRGIDVSHYQSRINWKAVAEDNDVNYVYIKVTENAGLVDNMFQTNLREARKVGIPVGCYHFFSPTASPLAQLKNLTSAVPHLGDHDLIPMIDVEVKGKRTSDAELRSRLKQFLKGVEDYYGVKPLIYTGQNFFNKYLSGYFDDYLFMIAKYSEGMPELEGNPKFALWQFSASGRVKGISGNVDQSCFVDNYGLRDILIKKKK
ncbi:MAG: glycosyl hydrolase family 25 [Bacteroidaceae bacterium]|nr:glycosyl hydrolase family 25 [Bacteroidaceae bacterium]